MRTEMGREMGLLLPASGETRLGGDIVDEPCAPWLRRGHARMHTRMRYAHESVLLAHVDVPDATTQVHLIIEVDHLHKYKGRREGGGSRRLISDG